MSLTKPAKVWLICFTLHLTACTAPAVRLQTQAAELGLNPIELKANGFTLAGFYRVGKPAETQAKPLHIYLEGDGVPWLHGLFPSNDPTTRSSVMLPLLGLDSEPVFYLARPCYNGHAQDQGCDETLWTSARFSERVVGAMAAAIQTFCNRYDYRQIILIGHSGGGSMAMLLAQRLPQTLMLVTLAVNYDVNRWVEFHNYHPLTSSLNPAAYPNNGIPEWHFLAENDRNIPPALFFQALKERKNSRVEILPEIDHTHGWDQAWPEILSRLKSKK